MKSRGIRIEDEANGVISVELSQILEEIHDGSAFYWSILFFEGIGCLEGGGSVLDLENKIYKSERGFFINWSDLNTLFEKLHQIIWVILIGCKDESLLRRYETDQEMYETCDVYIEMHDSSFWEVFSKDESLIERLAAKFKKIEFLETDFQSKVN